STGPTPSAPASIAADPASFDAHEPPGTPRVMASPRRAFMTQRNVERLLGRLLTDEQFRARFQVSPEAALADLVAGGWELTATEREALAAVDRASVAALARRMDPRISKVSLDGGATPPPANGLDGKEHDR